MTNDELQRIAAEAGFFVHPRKGEIRGPYDFTATDITDVVAKFAALVEAAERERCVALHDHEDVQAPIGNSAWGEAHQQGWGEGTAAYRDAIMCSNKRYTSSD